jgi:hypothetical protein
MNRLRQMCNLSWEEWQVGLAASYCLPLTACALRFRGLVWTIKWMTGSGMNEPGLPGTAAPEQAKSIARLVEAVAKHGVYRATCLKRSLVLCRFLRLKGIQFELKLGASRGEEGISAHAWVEHQGVAINDRKDIGEHFKVFSSASASEKADFL